MMHAVSLPKYIQSTWTDWVNQVVIFGFNSGKYDLNLVKELFIRMQSDMSDISVVKKDNT